MVLEKLAGRDRRSIGRSDEVVAEVLKTPRLFAEVFDGMLSGDPIIRLRSADAVEKITAQRPDYLQPYKRKLIQMVARIDQQEVQWHVAQMLPRLDLSARETEQVVQTLMSYLESKSRIVRTFAMQALADLAEERVNMRPQVLMLLKRLTKTGTPAMKSRGRKLLKRLGKLDA